MRSRQGHGLEQFCAAEHVSRRIDDPGQDTPPKAAATCEQVRVRTDYEAIEQSFVVAFAKARLRIPRRTMLNTDSGCSSSSIGHQLNHTLERFSSTPMETRTRTGNVGVAYDGLRR